MEMYDLYEELRAGVSRSLSFQSFYAALPEDYLSEANALRAEGLPVKLIALALDGNRPTCVCGKPTPADKYKYRFLTACSEECVSQSNMSFIDSLKASLVENESTYTVKEVGDNKITFECTDCGNIKQRTFKAASNATCPCNKAARSGAKLRMGDKVFKAKYLKDRKLRLVSPFTRMNAKHTFKCTVCKYTFEALASNVALRNSGCPRYECENHKAKTECLRKYGVEFHTQRESTKAAFKATMQERYGVDHPSQVAEFADRNRSYKRKPYKLGDREVQVQGYEPLALDFILTNHNVSADEIVCGTGSAVPTIQYRYKSKHRIYHPDIFIPKFNRLIEVKSTHTYKIAKAQIKAKARGCIEAGYKFTLLIMNADGTLHAND